RGWRRTRPERRYPRRGPGLAPSARPARLTPAVHSVPMRWPSARHRARYRRQGPQSPRRRRRPRTGCVPGLRDRRRRPVTSPGPPRHFGQEIGRAAALIGAITALARVVGFGRQLVFAHTVGSHCLGTAYTTANQVPNIIYDIVLGGALTGAVV